MQDADTKLGKLFKVIGGILWLHALLVADGVHVKDLQKEPDGRVSISDLRKSLERSSVKVSEGTLSDFFIKVDSSHQGSISYEEWR